MLPIYKIILKDFIRIIKTLINITLNLKFLYRIRYFKKPNKVQINNNQVYKIQSKILNYQTIGMFNKQNKTKETNNTKIIARIQI